MKELTKRLLERAMKAEVTTEHLGHEKNTPVTNRSGNVRNGKHKKKIRGDFGKLSIDIPRDRSYEPVILPKGQSRFADFDNKIISLYARGMTTREIQSHLEEAYGVKVSPSFISTITAAVTDDVRQWQNRPLDEVYPILYTLMR